jgi:hypothetical protein
MHGRDDSAAKEVRFRSRLYAEHKTSLQQIVPISAWSKHMSGLQFSAIQGKIEREGRTNIAVAIDAGRESELSDGSIPLHRS